VVRDRIAQHHLPSLERIQLPNFYARSLLLVAGFMGALGLRATLQRGRSQRKSFARCPPDKNRSEMNQTRRISFNLEGIIRKMPS
jgi:hypothetical protein